MLSRVANHTYWLGRYLERAEDMARTMLVHDRMLMDLSEVDRTPTWYQLIIVNSNEKLYAETYDEVTEQNVLAFLVTNTENYSSIVSALDGVRYNLRACRSIIPKGMYALVNELCLSVATVSHDNVTHAERRDFLLSVEHQLLAIAGAANGSMSYNKAFLFMRIGCFLERADMTSRILDVRSANLLTDQESVSLTPYENSQWIAILQSLQAFQMYMSEVRRPINGPDVLNFVLKNMDHPKSFRFCVQRLESFIARLPNTKPLQKQVDALLKQVDRADVHRLAKNQADLHEFMDSLQIQLADIGVNFSDHFFPVTEIVLSQEDEPAEAASPHVDATELSQSQTQTQTQSQDQTQEKK